MAILLTVRVKRAGQELPDQKFNSRDQRIVKIGRLESAHLRLDDPNASRIHAVIELTPRHATLVDMGTMIGTLLNGASASKTVLNTNDEITIGETHLLVSVETLPEVESEPLLPADQGLSTGFTPIAGLPNPYVAARQANPAVPVVATMPPPIPERPRLQARFPAAATGRHEQVLAAVARLPEDKLGALEGFLTYLNSGTTAMPPVPLASPAPSTPVRPLVAHDTPAVPTVPFAPAPPAPIGLDPQSRADTEDTSLLIAVAHRERRRRYFVGAAIIAACIFLGIVIIRGASSSQNERDAILHAHDQAPATPDAAPTPPAADNPQPGSSPPEAAPAAAPGAFAGTARDHVPAPAPRAIAPESEPEPGPTPAPRQKPVPEAQAAVVHDPAYIYVRLNTRTSLSQLANTLWASASQAGLLLKVNPSAGDAGAVLDARTVIKIPRTTKVTVAPGDTLDAIAQRVLGDARFSESIWLANQQSVADASAIDVGMVLEVPLVPEAIGRKLGAIGEIDAN